MVELDAISRSKALHYIAHITLAERAFLVAVGAFP